MKKMLIVLLALVLLVACGDDITIHDNVDKELAKDVMQVMDRIVYNVDNNIEYEDISTDDEKLFKQFQKKYEDDEGFPVDHYEGVNDMIRICGSVSLYKYMEGISFDSDKEFIKQTNVDAIKYIETGKTIGE